VTTKADILKAIRLKCLDCSGYQPREVRNCHLQGCALWSYRMGWTLSPPRWALRQILAYTCVILDGTERLAPTPGIDMSFQGSAGPIPNSQHSLPRVARGVRPVVEHHRPAGNSMTLQ
jgi:hypothetical protein